MSTRALIIRKHPTENKLQYGQTKWDGYNNTAILNKHWTDPEKIEALFNKLAVEQKGISSLRDTMETTHWYEDSYNCGESEVETWNEFEYPCAWRTIRFIEERFDWAEYVSVLFDGRWYDFDTSDLNTYRDLSRLLTAMQGKDKFGLYNLAKYYVTEYR